MNIEYTAKVHEKRKFKILMLAISFVAITIAIGVVLYNRAVPTADAVLDFTSIAAKPAYAAACGPVKGLTCTGSESDLISAVYYVKNTTMRLLDVHLTVCDQKLLTMLNAKNATSPPASYSTTTPIGKCSYQLQERKNDAIADYVGKIEITIPSGDFTDSYSLENIKSNGSEAYVVQGSAKASISGTSVIRGASREETWSSSSWGKIDEETVNGKFDGLVKGVIGVSS